MQSIKNNDNEIALLHGDLGLRLHRFVQRDVLLSYQGSGINQSEWKIKAGHHLVVTISGHPRLILYYRLTPTRKRVK